MKLRIEIEIELEDGYDPSEEITTPRREIDGELLSAAALAVEHICIDGPNVVASWEARVVTL